MATQTTTNEQADTRPASFIDSAGDEWKLKLTTYEHEQVKEHTGFNLFQMLGRVDGDAPGSDGIEGDTPGGLFAEMENNLGMVGTSIYVICEEQVVERGLSEKEFLQRLSQDSVTDATVALARAIVNFCPNKARRKLLHLILDQTLEVTKRELELLEQKANDPRVLKKMEGSIKKTISFKPKRKTTPKRKPTARKKTSRKRSTA